MNAAPLPLGGEIYPAYCHALSPTFNTWVKLTAADVHSLDEVDGFEGQNIYFHLNHPIRYVRLVGVLITFEAWERRWQMILDDSSGSTIEVVCPKPPPPPPPAVASHRRTRQPPSPTPPDLSDIDLGSVVKVKGEIGQFRGVRQILLKRINIIRETNEEAQCWRQLSAFRADVLSTPWSLSPEEVTAQAEEMRKQQRRKAERARRRLEHEQRRRQRSRHRKAAEIVGTGEPRRSRREDERRGSDI
ncbi:MAG: hypothetical protein M1817_005919 [Caeruleum heppii]|nr:MAG: hypothetical protein M1817_005919 [Caeruleum heppii]